MVVVLLVVEELGASRRQVGPQDFVAGNRRLPARVLVGRFFARLALILTTPRRSRRCALPGRIRGAAHGRFNLQRIDFDPLFLRGGALIRSGLRCRGGRCSPAFAVVPFAEPKNPRFDLHNRYVFVVFLYRRGQPMAHRDLGCLADVRQEVLGNGKLRNLFVVKGLARMAEDLRSSFDERHVLALVRALAKGGPYFPLRLWRRPQ